MNPKYLLFFLVWVFEGFLGWTIVPRIESGSEPSRRVERLELDRQEPTPRFGTREEGLVRGTVEEGHRVDAEVGNHGLQFVDGGTHGCEGERGEVEGREIECFPG